MKTIKSKLISSMLIIMLISMAGLQLNGQATPPPPPGPSQLRWMDFIPNLSQEQRELIVKLHTAMLKEVLPLQNQILEKEAHLRTLTTADKVDQKAVDKTIDDISDLRSEIQKKRMKFMMDARALLTEDQRVAFDQHRLERMNGKGYGRGKGKGRGNGRGYGQGNCNGNGPCRR